MGPPILPLWQGQRWGYIHFSRAGSSVQNQIWAYLFNILLKDAAQVIALPNILPCLIALNSSASKALQLFVGDEASETACMTSMFNNFFDAVNVSRLDEGKLTRSCYKSPYHSKDDFRLKVKLCNKLCSLAMILDGCHLFQWLEEDFLRVLGWMGRKCKWNWICWEENDASSPPKNLTGLRITGWLKECTYDYEFSYCRFFLSPFICKISFYHFWCGLLQ